MIELDKLNEIQLTNLNKKYGLVSEIHDSFLVVSNILAPLNSIVRIQSKTNEEVFISGIITKVSSNETIVSLFNKPFGITLNDKVILETEGIKIPKPETLIGEVVNPFGMPLFSDKKVIPEHDIMFSSNKNKFEDLAISEEQFITGVKAVDSFLPIVKGQRVSVNAGTGVGKTTFTSMLIKNAQSDIKIIALIGERTREVIEFVQKELNNDLTNTIVIASTSDDVPLMRKYAAITAIKLASYFGKSKDVLLVMDSLTRASIAQREIGFSNGEIPVLGGFPQSSFSFIPELLEEVGSTKNGSVTGFFTVLVDTEDEDDPITETPLANYIRGILDGHLFLDRKLAIKNVYPAINVPYSISRMSKNIKDFNIQWQENINKIKKSLAIIDENKLLIDLGSYQPGMNAELDNALSLQNEVYNFISQSGEHNSPLEETLLLFNNLANKII